MAANHIGNPLDFPERSRQFLKTADLLVFEEDRGARQALKSAGIHREYIKYNEHKQCDTMGAIKEALKKKCTVLYMSDQGCPTFSDPGSKVCALAWSLGATVKVIPGPSSLTAALSACPFDVSRFYCYGFPPQKKNLREKAFDHLSSNKNAVVLMDTPYRLASLLEECSRVFPAKRKAILAVDVSGEKEAFYYDSFSKLQEKTKALSKLNFILIVQGNEK